MRRVARRDVALLLFATTMAFIGSAAPGHAQQVPSFLGIPCTTQDNGVIGDTAHR
jgi:hypothetical protein